MTVGRPKARIPTHPGVILREDFLVPLGVSQAALARHLGRTRQSVNAVVQGKSPVTPDLAWALSGALGTTPEFWVQLQLKHDLVKAIPSAPVPPLPRRRPLGQRSRGRVC